MAEALGFLGLGQMGAAIARRLVGACPLHVFDPDPAAGVAGEGVVRHDSARAVAERAGIVFACLPTAVVSKTVAAELAGAASLGLYVEMSTIGREAVIAVADTLAPLAVVDAPVSGGPKGADAGTLAIMAAGEAGPLATLKPYFARIGRSVFEVGRRPGDGQMMKLVNNLISAANMASAFEALVLGAKAGLDPALMVDVVNASTGRNTATTDKVPRAVLNGRFDYGAKLETLYKDVTLGLAEAEALGVPMWLSQSVAQLWRFGMAQGMAEEDFTSLIKVMEGWAGAAVRQAGTP